MNDRPQRTRKPCDKNGPYVPIPWSGLQRSSSKTKRTPPPIDNSTPTTGVPATSVVGQKVAARSGGKGSSKTKSKPSVIKKEDVLLGRGSVVAKHEGNKYYRNLVKERKPRYQNVEVLDMKRPIAREICNLIYARGGRFLEKRGDDEWHEVTDRKRVLTKTCQCLREKKFNLPVSIIAIQKKAPRPSRAKDKSGGRSASTGTKKNNKKATANKSKATVAAVVNVKVGKVVEARIDCTAGKASASSKTKTMPKKAVKTATSSSESKYKKITAPKAASIKSKAAPIKSHHNMKFAIKTPRTTPKTTPEELSSFVASVKKTAVLVDKATVTPSTGATSGKGLATTTATVTNQEFLTAIAGLNDLAPEIMETPKKGPTDENVQPPPPPQQQKPPASMEHFVPPPKLQATQTMAFLSCTSWQNAPFPPAKLFAKTGTGTGTPSSVPPTQLCATPSKVSPFGNMFDTPSLHLLENMPLFLSPTPQKTPKKSNKSSSVASLSLPLSPLPVATPRMFQAQRSLCLSPMRNQKAASATEPAAGDLSPLRYHPGMPSPHPTQLATTPSLSLLSNLFSPSMERVSRATTGFEKNGGMIMKEGESNHDIFT